MRLGLLLAFAACGNRMPGDATPKDPPATGEVCKTVADGRTVCFPEGHVCTDPHGIGDGVPIVVDCWESGGQLCHPGNPTDWPACAGGSIR